MSREKMSAQGNTGRSRLDSLRLGSSRENKFFFGGGGETHYFQELSGEYKGGEGGL